MALPDDTMVRIAFHTDTGNVEHVWGDLLELGETEMRLRLRTLPTTQRGKVPEQISRRLSELEDWQVEQRDGSVRGSFSTLVTFLRTKERLGQLPPEMAIHERRYVDAAALTATDATPDRT